MTDRQEAEENGLTAATASLTESGAPVAAALAGTIRTGPRGRCLF